MHACMTCLTHAHTHTQTETDTHTRTHARTHARTHTHTRTHMHAHTPTSSPCTMELYKHCPVKAIHGSEPKKACAPVLRRVILQSGTLSSIYGAQRQIIC